MELSLIVSFGKEVCHTAVTLYRTVFIVVALQNNHQQNANNELHFTSGESNWTKNLAYDLPIAMVTIF